MVDVLEVVLLDDMDSVELDMDSELLDEDVLEDLLEGSSATAAMPIITTTITTAITAVVETPRLVRMSVVEPEFYI